MADTLKFGPEWLRALSGGSGSTSSSTGAASVTSPPPTPSAPAGFPGKFKLATYRYGREEMLALFLPKPTVPEELRTFPMIVSEQCLEPVAFIDMTEEEQALLSQSVNSFRVQPYNPRMMGPSSRARGSERGRGRGGRGALYTGKSNEFDNDGPRLPYMRPRIGRPDSWDDGEKRFDRPDRTGDRAPTLTSGGGGLGPLRSGLAASDDRTASQLSPRRDFNRSLSNDSWRELKPSTSDAEKDRDWRRAGPGPVPPLAGVRPGGRWRERSFDDRPGESFSGTQRQYSGYERTFGSEGGGGDDDLPEWAVDEPNEGELPAGGTFDASGQFMPLKDSPANASHSRYDGDEDGDHTGAEKPANVAAASSVIIGASAKDVTATKVEKIAVAASINTGTSERSPLIEQQLQATPLPSLRDRVSPKLSLPPSISHESTPKSDSLPAPSLSTEVSGLGTVGLPCGSSSIKPKESCMPITVNSTNGAVASTITGSNCTEAGTVPPVSSSASVVVTSSVAAPVMAAINVTNQLSVHSRSETLNCSTSSAGNVLIEDKSRLSKDIHEADFEHFAKAAEALVETLSAEDEDHVPRTGSTFQPLVHQHKLAVDNLATPSLGDLKPDSSFDQWFYKDPQGAIQGPFGRAEMAEWFNAGYFNMALLVRRACDDVFQPLGELIKRFQRVPFEPGPHVPPLKDFLLDEQQRMMHYAAMQQQQQAVAALQQQVATAAAIQQQQQQQQVTQRQNVMKAELIQMMSYLQSNESFKHYSPQQLQQYATSLLTKQYQQQQQVKMMATPGGAAVLGDGRPVSLTEPSGESLWGTSNTTTAMSPSPLINAHATPMWKPPISSGKAPTPTAVMGVQSVWELEQQQHQQQDQKLRETEEKRREIERQLKIQKDEEEKRRREAEDERRRRAEAAAQADAERLQQLQQQLQPQLRPQQMQQQMQMQQQAEEQERLAAAELQQRRQQQQAIAEAMSHMEKQEQRQAESQRRQQEQRQVEIQRRAATAAIAQQQQPQSQAKLPSTAQWAKSKQPSAMPTMAGAVPSGHLTLAQIQEQQEEREKQRQRQLEVMRQQQQQEAMIEANRQQQQNKSWVLAASSAGIPSTKSLREIQDEERLRQQQLIDTNRQQQNTAAGRLASAVGSTNVVARPGAASVLSWDGAWTTTKAPVPSTPASASGVWEKQGTSSGKIPTSGMDSGFPSLGVTSSGTASTAKLAKSTPGGGSAAQRSKQMAGTGKTKEEDKISKLFSWSTGDAQSAAADELTQWCIGSLRSLNDSLDAPFLAKFLNTVESPEEVQEYVQSYCGNNGAVQNFIKQYLQRRGRRGYTLEDEDSLWEVKPPQQQPTRNVGNSKVQPQQQRPGAAAGRPADQEPDDRRNVTNGATDTGDKKSKAKKKKMLKVDSGALLGFSVQPSSERFNVGEIEKAKD